MNTPKFSVNQTIQSVSMPVICGKILHILTLETKKWDPITKKPTGDTVVSFEYVIISIGTNHSHTLKESDSVLVQ